MFVYFGASICALTLDIERWIRFGAMRSRTDIVMEMKIKIKLKKTGILNKMDMGSSVLPNLAITQVQKNSNKIKTHAIIGNFF